tara:strand:+ start:322 stop:1629 length:1308 start_codon:yes stop_codon:yes gene_type:complete
VKKMGKNLIQSGIGFSKEKDSYQATKLAAKTALKQLKGKAPGLTLVFYAGNYNPKEINKALKEEFKGTEFIGGSTDAVIYKDNVYAEGIVITSMYSTYLHFGVSSIDNISKNPKKLAAQTIKNAVGKTELNSYTDSYMAFSRVKKGNLTELIRIPSFFVFAFTRGYQPTRMGNEDLIIEGIGETIGHYIPVFGGSLGNDMDKVFSNTPYDITTFHSGKIMKDGLVTAFACTGLAYASSLAHGAKPLNHLGYVSDVTGHGFVVSKINDKPIIDWYAKNIGVTKKEFMKKLLFYTQKYPLGFPDGYGNIVMRAGGVPHPKGLAYIAPFKENTPVYIMNVNDNKQLMKSNKELLSSLNSHMSIKEQPTLNFLVSCSSRRRILDKRSYKKELTQLSKQSKSPLFGFCSFGEIGSKPAETCHFQHLCTNVFTVYNKLLSK